MKVHAVLPMYNDPLLCELYFRNYAKYKNRYIDHLYIVLSPFDILHGDTIAEYELKNKIVRDHTIDDFVLTHRIYNERAKEHEHKNNLLVKLLADLNINNYDIIPTSGNLHGHMICTGMQAARCADAHIVIEEQDAYWLNDDYKQYLDLLQHVDIIGAKKGSHPKIDVQKFNIKYNKNHPILEDLHALHLPEFLSNRIVRQTEHFSGMNGPILAKDMDVVDVLKDGNDDTSFLYFDTFQNINLEMYKKTDKTKFFNSAESSCEIGVENPWSIVSEFMDKTKKTNTIIGSNYDDKVVYHTGELRNLAFANLSVVHSKDKAYDLLKDYAVVNPDHKVHDLDFVKELRCSFYYQSLATLNTLYNKNNYLSNFDHLRDFVDFYKYDCSELIKKIV